MKTIFTDRKTQKYQQKYKCFRTYIFVILFYFEGNRS